MKICIIEDEVLLAERIQQKLERNGYNVSMYTSYSSFMNQHSLDADLYIIDIALGDGSGFDIINWLRETKKSIAPVIITSGYNDTERKVYGLDIGADDYLPKPFSPRELLARIRALTRRNSEATKTAIIEYKDISLNLENKKVSI
ncbi:MAG: response regulator transcription factor [Candidatus Peribacteria bacterium]|nr:MAG: response regulator transcription factor [Candidatus Peribacteria bacterium]